MYRSLFCIGWILAMLPQIIAIQPDASWYYYQFGGLAIVMLIWSTIIYFKKKK